MSSCVQTQTFHWAFLWCVIFKDINYFKIVDTSQSWATSKHTRRRPCSATSSQMFSAEKKLADAVCLWHVLNATVLQQYCCHHKKNFLWSYIPKMMRTKCCCGATAVLKGFRLPLKVFPIGVKILHGLQTLADIQRHHNHRLKINKGGPKEKSISLRSGVGRCNPYCRYGKIPYAYENETNNIVSL